MGDSIDLDKNEQPIKPRVKNQIDTIGKVGLLIGSGKHAKTAIVWHVIRWSFIAGGITSVFVFVRSWNSSDNTGYIDQLLKIWGVFLPIITLAMGYLFGKGQE